MNKYVSIVIVLVLIVFGVWFSNKSTVQKEIPVVEQNLLQDKDNINNQEVKENKKIMQAILHTNKGDITIEFFDAQAPKTVANFVKLAQEGFYDGIKFHRVIAGFMIQGGDPLTKDDSKMAMWGTGGPGYQFADELGLTNKNDVGTISMANAGPNTNGSQFFINVAANNFLDGKHTVFGKVTVGMDVVTAIENVKVGASDRPIEAVVINSITLK
jgi:cyclophilin family peptidyl-prolyl cis-trans isomerase